MKVKFSQTLPTNTKYTLIGSNPQELTRFISAADNILNIYRLVNPSDERVEFSFPEQSDPEKVEAAVKNGKAFSSVTGGASMASDILAFLGIVLSADKSGATLKFSQISKLISRLRYVGLNYGDVFGNFLSGLGKSFVNKSTSELDGDLKKKKEEEILKAVKIYKQKQEYVSLVSNGNKGKFTRYGMDLFLIGKTNKGFVEDKNEEKRKLLSNNKSSSS